MVYFGDENHGRWLHAFSDSSLGISTITPCMVLVPSEDGHQLVIADFKIRSDSKPRLKVFSGTSMISEQIIPDIPAGIVTFPVDKYQMMPLAVGVACGSDILVFRNNKPYYKYSLPKLPMVDLEQDVWRRLSDAHMEDIPVLVELLNAIPFEDLTSRSKTFLCIPKENREAFIKEHKDLALEKKSTITCIATLPKKINDSLQCIFVGTEIGDILVIDPLGFSVIHQARVCASNVTPFIMLCSGQYDVEFRCVIACREGVVSVLKHGWLEGNVLFTVTDGSIVSMTLVPDESTIIIATNSDLLLCYTKKGKKLWNITLPGKPITISTVPLKHYSCNLIAVALQGGSVYLYKGRKHIDTIIASNTVNALLFGPLGQEDNVIVLNTMDGSLVIKILKRTADYDHDSIENESSTKSTQQVKPLAIPKKNKLFVEQTNRERQNAIEMHQVFQQELCRLRLLAARTTANFINTTEVSNTAIQLHAQVVGLGPSFTLTLSIICAESNKPLSELELIFHVSASAYTLSQSFMQLPTLHPGITYTFNTQIIEKEPKGWNNDGDIHSTDEIEEMSYTPLKIFIVKKNESQPLSASRIHLPLTERILY